MSSVRASVFFSLLDRYATAAINFVMLVVLSRLLTPPEIGLYAAAAGLIIIADQLRDMGASNYLIGAKSLTEETVRCVFTITFAISMLVFAATWSGAAAIAGFFAQPAMKELLRISSLVFLISSIANPLVATLRRDLNFRATAMVSVANGIGTLAVSIVCALLGFGAMSLAYGGVAGATLGMAAALFVRPWFWIYRPSFSGWQSLLSFGGYSSLTALLNVAYQLLPQLALGRLIGFDATGVYNRATSLCQIPERALVGAVGAVALPALSARMRAGGCLKSGYLKAIGMMSGVQWPFLLCLAVLAEPAVSTLLGSQWAGAVTPVRLIAVSLIFLAPSFMTYPVLVTTGRVRDTLTSSIISLPASATITILAASFGANWTAASLLLTSPFQMAVALIFLRRAIGITFLDVLAANQKSAFVSAASAVVPAILVLACGPGLSGLTFAAALAGAATFWAGALWWIRHPLFDELSGFARMIISKLDTAISAQRNAG